MQCGQHALLLCHTAAFEGHVHESGNVISGIQLKITMLKLNVLQWTLQLVMNQLPKKTVMINVTVLGSCRHMSTDVDIDKRNCRPLARDSRKDAAQQLCNRTSTPTSMYYSKLSHTSDAECEAGNMTTCQSPQVQRQAGYELRKHGNTHHDVVLELRQQREDWMDSEIGRSVHGFLHTIDNTPFLFSFYLEKQVEVFVSTCHADDGGMINFDATGSVIERIKN